MFSNTDLYSFVSPSAYDTAWLAMIPDPHQPDRPMFAECLDWMLNSQRERRVLGEFDGYGVPTIDCLPATLACMVALKRWNVGPKEWHLFMRMQRSFLKKSTIPVLGGLPLFSPAMVELAGSVGLEIILSDGLKATVAKIFNQRLQILNTEELVDKYHYPPLISYLEALPSWYDISREDIVKHLSDDGSIFQSPSATAHAFMVSGRKSVWPTFNLFFKDALLEVDFVFIAVPPIYPMDEELVKLSMVNQLQRLGLAQQFVEEIDEILSVVHRNLLEKSISLRHLHDNLVVFPNFRRMIEQELSLPWTARLDHLDHRKWIEVNEIDTLWMGKASFYGLSCLHEDDLIRLATENYKFRQSIYNKELVEVTRWSKDLGLSNMGFGREKTTYCYFASAAASSSQLPHHSEVRLVVAKVAILITVADDFFDMQGSLDELESLTEAVRRWDGRGLTGHSEVIFKALDNLVNDIAGKYIHQQGGECDIAKILHDMWYEAFSSWLTEAKWSKSGYIPSTEEYLRTGMISIAAHTVALQGSCFLNPSLPIYKLTPTQYEPVTKLLMVITRLLNDIQSYQKEQVDGKTNLVLLHKKENPETDIEDSISYVRGILDEKKKELLEHVLSDGLSDLPKSCKHIHLSCMKVFQMFFNSGNEFDSNTSEMLEDVKQAIYIPLEFQTSKPSIKPLPLPSERKKGFPKVNAILGPTFKNQTIRSFTAHSIPLPMPRVAYGKMFMPLKFKTCFI
ncbi:(E,E)-geranyllinalool synthase [Vitis vinifera]|uniref:(E,E)-geranyllinalool synthase n=1 Tax=Vitis vinifera TaxID=29760 RepID=A0A438JHS7_VITVI|nr:(E,E)-geranyllinalool synthase [Vitis vinifera]